MIKVKTIGQMLLFKSGTALPSPPPHLLGHYLRRQQDMNPITARPELNNGKAAGIGTAFNAMLSIPAISGRPLIISMRIANSSTESSKVDHEPVTSHSFSNRGIANEVQSNTPVGVSPFQSALSVGPEIFTS